MRPLTAASGALVAGAALGSWLPQEPSAWGWAALAALAAWATLLACGAARVAARTGLALFAILGIYRCQGELTAVYAGPEPLPEADVVIGARLARPAEFRDGAAILHAEQVLLRSDGATSRVGKPLQVLVGAGGGGPYRVGDLIVARGRLRTIRGDRNLGWFPGPVAPAGRRYAARLIVASPAWVRRAGNDRGRGAGAAVLRWRDEADRFWKARPGPAAGILNALTTGERAGIGDEALEQFRRSGLTHLLAISGMNVGFLVAAVFLGLRRLLGLCEWLVLRVPAQPLAALLALPSLWFFLLFSGSQLPVERAALSGAAALAAVVASRRIAAGDACAVAALAIVALDPRALFSASFQLSFAAVAALVLVAPRLGEGSPAGERGPTLLAGWRRGARSLLLVSLAASAVTAPLVAFHFQQVSFVGPLANLLAVPFTGLLLLPGAWLTLAAATFSPAAGGLLAHLAGLCAEALISCAAWFARPSWAALHTARPPLLLTLCLLALALVSLPPPDRRLRRWAVALCAAGALTGGWWTAAAHGRRLLVAALDVGQGLAVAVLLPGGRSLLYDAGPSWGGYDAGERVVVPALRRLGLWRLDLLVVSHGHPDHGGGVPAVRRALGGEGLFVAPGGRRPARGDELALGGGVSARVLNAPAAEGDDAGRDANDRSLALLLAWEGAGLVLTGDAGPGVAPLIVAAASPAPPHLLLQAPHHGGSAEACRCLAVALRPEVSVIPVGRNSYGHPRAGAVAALEEEGRVLRSDRDGAVFALSTGAGFEVRTWRELSRARTWRERVRWLGEGW